MDGVVSTTSGFSGGRVPDPSYQQVTQGSTGHREVVRIVYDPDRVSYEELLSVYWRNVDPVDGSGQFCVRGDTYAPVVYTTGAAQAELAEQSWDVVADLLNTEIAVEIRSFEAFYPAENFHQDYYMNNPLRYRFYRSRCGRDNRLEAVWERKRSVSTPSRGSQQTDEGGYLYAYIHESNRTGRQNPVSHC